MMADGAQNQGSGKDKPHYGPVNAFRAPRYTGLRTFARCPFVQDLEGVDVAVVGIPFDTATSYRAGPRFGPEGIRRGSILLRPYHPVHKVDIFEKLSVIDYGDIEIVPGNAAKTNDRIAEGLRPIVERGITPIVLGGDHSIVLGELRAHAAVHGPLALVLLDAHADVWDLYYGGERYFHGTPFRRALEEGLIDPHRSVLAGMRGSLYGEEDYGDPREMGFEVIPCDDLRQLTPAQYSDRVRSRVGTGPAYFSFDIDVLDPTFAPATGTPELAGLFSHEALAFIRSLAGMKFVGYDVVEVSPPYDTAGENTTMLAAGIAYEFLGLTAIA
jgi:agmatinase